MKDRELLREKIEQDKKELFELLGSLIKINSENFISYGNETQCPDYIKNYCVSIGLQAEVYSPLTVDGLKNHPDYFEGRHLEERKNCTVTLKGKNDNRKLMLAAHHDTVQIGNESEWSFPPLCGIVKDGKVLGRGACDDKYAIATSLFLIKKIKELAIELDYDLLFTAYCDEEYGGSHGALATCLKYPCDDYVNLDCKNFDIWKAGVGGGELKFIIQSAEAEDNCSKVFEGIKRVVEYLNEFRQKRQKELEKNIYFQGSVVARNACRIMNFNAGGSGSTSMNQGELKITYYTDKDEKYINNELSVFVKEINAEFSKLGLQDLTIEKATRFFHYVECETNNPIIDKMKKAGMDNGKIIEDKGACLSDYPMFILYGSPRAICFGIGADFDRPGGAHQVNEYVDCDALVDFAKIMGDFLLSY